MGKKIMIVDDSDSIRRIMRLTLMTEQYDVLEAEDGARAVDLLKGHPDCALVITDLAMPTMDGQQLLQWIRNDWGNQRLPVFVLTAEDDPATKIGQGVNRIIRKPFSPIELLESVRAALQETEP